jgi:two-component system, cell cycle response regulator
MDSPKRKTVLLVDDDEDLLQQVGAVVSKEYDVDQAYSGEEAMVKLAQNPYDCIVMDVMMQTLGEGLETAKKIKENPATKTVPIIMLTSVNKHYDYRTQIDESFFPNDTWLDKPVDQNVLMQEIRKLVK